MEGKRVGDIEHRPYPCAVKELERRLNAEVAVARGSRVE